MIYSRSAEYAIRSFVYLARIPDGKFAMARQIARVAWFGRVLPGMREWTDFDQQRARHHLRDACRI